MRKTNTLLCLADFLSIALKQIKVRELLFYFSIEIIYSFMPIGYKLKSQSVATLLELFPQRKYWLKLINQVLIEFWNKARVVNYRRLFFTVMLFFIHFKMKIASSVRVSTELEQQQHLHFCTTGEGGGGPRVVVSTAAFHARVRGSVPGLGGL